MAKSGGFGQSEQPLREMLSYEKFMTKRSETFLYGNQTFVSQVETGKLESFNTPLLASYS